MRTSRLRIPIVLVALAVLAVACGSSDNSKASGGNGGTTGGAGKTGGTMVFGTSADPVSLDPSYVSDGESLRVSDQIFETLVTTEPGGTKPAPKLAKSWSPDSTGKVWTFKLQTGVKFHDGTVFDAKAVCTNFDRWYNFKGIQQSPNVSYYWSTVFAGFAKNEDPALPKSLYQSCSAPDAATAEITLSEPSASFVAGLAVPAFSIASPAALTKYKADDVGGTADEPKLDNPFSTAHPVGTGPFELVSWKRNEALTMKRFDGYWGKKAILDKVIFKPIAKGPDRRAALEAGDIQGFDQVDPADMADLKDAGYELLERPAFNVGYLGFNQKIKPLDNPMIREAIAHAVNRDALVKANYPAGSEVAKEFMPPELFGYSKDVKTYDYSLQKAKDLIKQSGVTDLSLEFWYPTNVSRPYMPDPESNFQAMKSDLEKAGFTIKPKSADWATGYQDALQTGKAAIYLYGWTGDFGDPDNFVGTFFRTAQPQWGFTNQPIFDLLNKARGESDEASRTTDYERANGLIMDFLPGLPYVHTKPALAFRKDVKGYVPSPVSIEPFSTVSLNG